MRGGGKYKRHQCHRHRIERSSSLTGLVSGGQDIDGTGPGLSECEYDISRVGHLFLLNTISNSASRDRLYIINTDAVRAARFKRLRQEPQMRFEVLLSLVNRKFEAEEVARQPCEIPDRHGST